MNYRRIYKNDYSKDDVRIYKNDYSKDEPI
jgi:hypothetical protein